MIGEEPKTPLRDIPLEKFFEAFSEGNEQSEDQVVALRKAFMDILENVRLSRAGEIEIEIYLLGKDEAGNVSGLQTLSDET